jgi:hypothetical protein
MKLFADHEMFYFREKGHPALLSGLDNYSLEEATGVHLTLKQPPLGLKAHRSMNNYFLDTVYNADIILIIGGDSQENTLLGRICTAGSKIKEEGR